MKKDKNKRAKIVRAKQLKNPRKKVKPFTDGLKRVVKVDPDVLATNLARLRELEEENG